VFFGKPVPLLQIALAVIAVDKPVAIVFQPCLRFGDD
jgi:hypothetical protein